ncbi:unnamed protein product [Spodoptera littoralis]|uniref:Uncharacterized protein n=1 Tax=Spodoptera littoralis TaxID=7109 RepID=A0A9P0IAU9_SPOLI|nr:unnamed protein product [Spodoptera littoralis]CAH1643493.1 unnamed protein product [Spodoptera littoralis]
MSRCLRGADALTALVQHYKNNSLKNISSVLSSCCGVIGRVDFCRPDHVPEICHVIFVPYKLRYDCRSKNFRSTLRRTTAYKNAEFLNLSKLSIMAHTFIIILLHQVFVLHNNVV